MPIDLSDTLVVAVTSTALFDLSEADAAFRRARERDPDSAIERYRAYMEEREDVPLAPGTGFPLVSALLKLNRFMEAGETSPLVEVVVMSRNSPETGLCVLNSIRSRELKITRSAFTGGESVVDYLDAFDVDLFLTTSPEDAQRVTDAATCATAVLLGPPPGAEEGGDEEVRIAFDGDAVLFDEESELVYKTQGLEAFHASEDAARNTPLAEGPYAKLLKKLARLQERLPGRVEYSPVRIAIVTARDAPADLRVVYTLRQWGVYVDQVFFLGGVEKGPVLKALRPQIFFDDQDRHLDGASQVVPSGKVPYKTSSPLYETGPPRRDEASPEDAQREQPRGPEKKGKAGKQKAGKQKAGKQRADKKSKKDKAKTR